MFLLLVYIVKKGEDVRVVFSHQPCPGPIQGLLRAVDGSAVQLDVGGRVLGQRRGHDHGCRQVELGAGLFDIGNGGSSSLQGPVVVGIPVGADDRHYDRRCLVERAA